MAYQRLGLRGLAEALDGDRGEQRGEARGTGDDLGKGDAVCLGEDASDPARAREVASQFLLGGKNAVGVLVMLAEAGLEIGEVLRGEWPE